MQGIAARVASRLEHGLSLRAKVVFGTVLFVAVVLTSLIMAALIYVRHKQDAERGPGAPRQSVRHCTTSPHSTAPGAASRAMRAAAVV